MKVVMTRFHCIMRLIFNNKWMVIPEKFYKVQPPIFGIFIHDEF